MNQDVFAAARAAGCSPRESQVLAWYVELDSIKEAAFKVGVSPETARNYANRLRRRLGAPHMAAAVVKVLRPE